MNKKKIIIIAVVIIAIIIGVWMFKKYYHPKEDTRSVYEALVNVVDDKSGSPEEDRRSSLKKGDVIAVFPENHPWTDTEKTSYLIVKIKLEAEDAAKLTEAVLNAKPSEKPNASPSDNAPQQETVQARKYRLDISIPTVNEIMLKGQPYGDKVFEKGVIEEK